jgi:6-phosphogluconolactonase
MFSSWPFLPLLVLACFAMSAVEGATTHLHSNAHQIYATTKDSVASLLFTPPNKLDLLSETQSEPGASWIAFDTEKGYGYVLGEKAGVLRLSDKGKTERVGHAAGYSTSTEGDEPVAGSIVHGCLIVANYGSGSAAIIRISPNDHLLSSPPAQVIQYTRKGVGPVTERQDHSYAHDVSISPDQGWAYICDLGSDQIHRIQVNKQDGTLHSTKIK